MSEQAFQVNKQGVGTMTPAEQRSIFWRSFTIQGSWSFDKMMAYGCMYALEKPLRRIYSSDDDSKGIPRPSISRPMSLRSS